MNSLQQVGRRQQAKFYVALLSLIILYRFLPFFQGYVLFGEDILFQNIPNRVFTARTIQAGTMPFWTDNIFFGYPLFAEGQAGVLYPFHLLTLLADPILTYHWVILFHFFLALFGSWLWLTLLFRSATVYAIGTALYLEVLFDLVHFTNMFEAFAWLPIFLYLLQQWVVSNKHGYALATSISFALASLTLHTEAVFYIALFALLFGLAYRPKPWFAKFVLVIFTSFLIGAFQFVPHLELLLHSERVHHLLPFNSSLALSLKFFSRGAVGEGFSPPFSLTLIWLFTILLLGIRYVCRGRGKWYLLSGGVLALLSLGSHTPIYPLFARVFPPFRWLRNPHRLFSLVGLFFFWLLSLQALDRAKPFIQKSAALLFLLCYLGNISLAPIQRTYQDFFTLSLFQDRYLKPEYYDKVNLIFWVHRDLYREGEKLLRHFPKQGQGGRILVGPNTPLSRNLALLYNFETFFGYTPLYTTYLRSFLNGDWDREDVLTSFGVHYALGELALSQRRWRRVFSQSGVIGYESSQKGRRAFTLKGQKVAILKWSAQERIFQVDGSGEDALVVATGYYPGWIATVNGKRKGLSLFHRYGMVIPLSGGRERVVLRFQPLSIYFGLWLSVIALFICFGLSLRYLFHRTV